MTYRAKCQGRRMRTMREETYAEIVGCSLWPCKPGDTCPKHSRCSWCCDVGYNYELTVLDDPDNETKYRIPCSECGTGQ